jgi:hypothetical protein
MWHDRAVASHAWVVEEEVPLCHVSASDCPAEAAQECADNCCGEIEPLPIPVE